MDKQYTLRFLPLFEHDLNNAVDYIASELKNPDAAMKLIDDVEAAIYRRQKNPEAFEPFHSLREREYPYYRIGVGNYNVFYVVIGDVMEVRRLLYSGRDWRRKI